MPELPRFVRKTDEQGRCTFCAPEACDEYRLRIAHDGRQIDRYWEFAAKLTATLPWFGPMRGSVVDAETGAPLANVVVRFDNIGTGDWEEAGRTDASGNFELAWLPRDHEQAFVFDVTGYVRQGHSRTLPGNGTPVACTFALERGVALSGRFVDEATRAPIAGVAIRSQHYGAPIGTSQVDGRFRVLVRANAAGNAVLQATAPGYCRHSFTMPNEKPTPGFALDDYPLVASATLAGRVQSATGVAVAGATVWARCSNKAANPSLPDYAYIQAAGSSEATTNARGEFVINGLLPHSDYRLRVAHEDFEPSPWSAPGNAATTHPGELLVTISLRPKPPASAFGMIVGTYRCNGQPESGMVQWESGTQSGERFIEKNGEFRIERVPLGVVKLKAAAFRFEGARNELEAKLYRHRTVRLAAGEQVEVAFDLQVEETTIAGTVTESDGTPMADQAIRGKSASFDTMLVRTDADGAFTLHVPASLPALTVQIYEVDMQPPSQIAKPGATGVDFVRLQPVAVRIRAKSPSGRLLRPSIAVAGNWPGGFRRMHGPAAPDPDGFTSWRMPHGTTRVFVCDVEHSITAHDVDPDQNTVIDTVLPRTVKLTVHLAGNQPEPASPAYVRLVDDFEEPPGRLASWWNMPRRVPLQHAGESIAHVGPGRHRLVAEDPKLEVVPDTVHVAGTDVTLEVRLRQKSSKAR